MAQVLPLLNIEPVSRAYPPVPAVLLPMSLTTLAAQCEITPHTAQYPFEIVSQRGGIASICLVLTGYRAIIAEIPLLRGGVSHLHFACSPRGDMLRKGGGGIAPTWPC